jgi:hypothetical protein
MVKIAARLQWSLYANSKATPISDLGTLLADFAAPRMIQGDQNVWNHSIWHGNGNA